ncbi:STAS domain-containing protein [Streptomyces sp. M19]
MEYDGPADSRHRARPGRPPRARTAGRGLRRRPCRRCHRPAVLRVRGGLDLTTAPAVRAHLHDAVARRTGRVLYLDLSAVTSCDVLGLGVLVAAGRRARLLGGDLRLVAPSPPVVEALTDSGLGRVLRVVPGLTTAAA